jgi:hypothetical protein
MNKMKTKNLLAIGFLVITLCLMNHFANAQSCNNGHPCPTGYSCKNHVCVANPPMCVICRSGCSFICAMHVTCSSVPHYESLGWHLCGSAKTDETLSETTPVDEMLIYPNPASNYITISVPSDEEAVLQIMNIMGQIIVEQKITTQAEIDVSAFHAGVYIARWSDGENKGTKMFTVTK